MTPIPFFPYDRFTAHPTPFYYYDIDLLRATLRSIAEASAHPGFKVHYAVKANCDSRVLREISAVLGGADVVSGGEIRLAVEAGFNPADIVFAGVGKTDSEIIMALDLGIGIMNVESVPELEVISQIASARGKTARVALRINPDIDAHTHHYITTGLAENKFGIDMRDLDRVADMAISLPGIELAGLHFHIGSQITITEPFELLCSRINAMVAQLSERGVKISHIDVGGGLGIDYDDPDANPVPDFKSYFDTFARHLEVGPGVTVHFELGRAVVAQCGSLISRVLYYKEGREKRFAILDAGMSELLRPALYQAVHRVDNLTPGASQRPVVSVDVVGPVCESADVFVADTVMPEPRRGDIMAIRSAGAYGETMSSAYNCRCLNETLYGCREQ